MSSKNTHNIPESIDNSEYETESEISETEAKPPTKSHKKKEYVEVNGETVEIVPKKPKRVMSEAQKKVLAAARVKARAVIKEKAELTKKRKELKKERHLLKKLEYEADLAKHNEYKKKLLTEAGLVPKEIGTKIRKKRVEKGSDDDSDTNEILELEQKISKLRTRKVKKPEPEPEPESESEEERNLVVEKKASLRRKREPKSQKDFELESQKDFEPQPEPRNERLKPKTPIIKKNDSVIDESERFKPNQAAVRTTQDKDINSQIRLLFPNY